MHINIILHYSSHNGVILAYFIHEKMTINKIKIMIILPNYLYSVLIYFSQVENYIFFNY